MKVTFLVDIDLEPDAISTLPEISEDIMDAIELAGFNVTSVKPWKRPVTLPTLPSIIPPAQ